MKRVIAAVAAVLTLGLPAGAEARLVGGAQPSRTFVTAGEFPGCRLDGVIDPASRTFTGVIQGHIVSTFPMNAAFCRVRINTAPGTPYFASVQGSGTTAVLPPTAIAFGPVDDTDIVQVCTGIVVNGVTTEQCKYATTAMVPPQEIYDLLDTLFVDVIDPLLCPLLAAVAPINISNQFQVTAPQGDVYLGSTLIYDCPPYQP